MSSAYVAAHVTINIKNTKEETTRKRSWSKGDARQQCVYEDPWKI